MKLTVEECIALVQSGAVKVWCYPENEEEGHYSLVVTGIQLAADAVRGCIAKYGNRVYLIRLVYNNNVLVCPAPEDHRETYIHRITPIERIQTCLACAEMRNEEIRVYCETLEQSKAEGKVTFFDWRKKIGIV